MDSKDFIEYINERIDAKTLSNTKSMLFASLKYCAGNSKDIIVTDEQIKKLTNNKLVSGTDAVLAFIGNQYDLKTTSLKRAEQFEKISNIACKVAVIAGSFKDLYDSCENYFDKNNAEKS